MAGTGDQIDFQRNARRLMHATSERWCASGWPLMRGELRAGGCRHRWWKCGPYRKRWDITHGYVSAEELQRLQYEIDQTDYIDSRCCYTRLKCLCCGCSSTC